MAQWVLASSMPLDGQRDFDFELGFWKTQLRRLARPLSGSKTWVEYAGTTTVRPIWNGRANLVELEVDGPQGHLEGFACGHAREGQVVPLFWDRCTPR